MRISVNIIIQLTWFILDFLLVLLAVVVNCLFWSVGVVYKVLIGHSTFSSDSSFSSYFFSSMALACSALKAGL